MKNRAMRLGGALVCAITISTAAVAVPVPCAAQSKPERARARDLYAQGQRLFKEGNFDAAQSAFEEALRVLPNPVVLLSIAECQTRTEHFEDAIATLERYLAERPDAPDLVPVRQQIIAIQNTPAEVRVMSTPPGAELSIDGATSGKSTPYTLQTPAGTHQIAAYTPGYARSEQTVTLHIGPRNEPLTFSLEPAPAQPPPPVAAPSSEPYVGRTRHRKADATVWATLGVAAAGFVGGSVLGVRALKQKSVFDDRPSEKGADNGERLALFSDVCFGIGAAGSITALILYLTSDVPPQEARLTLTPVADTRRVGLFGALRF